MKYQEHFLRRTKKNIFTIQCVETMKRPLKLSELPLKTDLVVWMPLTADQKKLYKFILNHNNNQDVNFKSAFHLLSYVKKLILHPHLLSDTPLDRKREIGFITEAEEAHLEAQEEEAWNHTEAQSGINTRRARSCSTAKPKEPKKVEPPKKFELTPKQKADKIKRRKLFD